MAGLEAPPHQYGRADLARRAARLWHEPLRDRAAWPARLFRCRDLAAVLPADRTHARPYDARTRPAGGEGAGAARGPWRARGAGGWHSHLFAGGRDRDWNDNHARCRRTRAG